MIHYLEFDHHCMFKIGIKMWSVRDSRPLRLYVLVSVLNMQQCKKVHVMNDLKCNMLSSEFYRIMHILALLVCQALNCSKWCIKFLQVFLKDIAEVEIVPLQNLQLLDPKFMDTRDGAVKCHLAGVRAAGDKTEWPSLACEYLSEQIAKYPHFCIAKKVCKSYIPSWKTVYFEAILLPHMKYSCRASWC